MSSILGVAISIISVSRYKFGNHFIYSSSDALEKPCKSSIINKKNTFYFFACSYFSLIFLESLFEGGLPLAGIIGIGNAISYDYFGIPGVHGIANSFGYISVILCIYQFKTRTKEINYFFLSRPRYYLFAYFLVLLLLMQRQVLISILLQVLAINLYFNPIPRFKILFIKSLFGFLVFLILFGIFGDLRSGGRDHFLYFSGLIDIYPDFLPTGFAWFFFYLTSPIYNTFFNSGYIQNFDYSLLPLNTAPSLIPSFLRPERSVNFDLYSHWNVHSIYSYLISDFGPATFVVFILLGFFFLYIRQLSQRDKKYSCAYSVVFMMVILSMFSDMMIHVTIVFELIFFLIAAKATSNYS